MKQFLRLAKNDPAAFQTLIQETIAALEDSRGLFRDAVLAGNQETFKKQTDKIKMTIALLRADKLQKMLNQTTELLGEPDLSEEERHAVANQLDSAFHSLITDLKNAA